jgi:hypothetical protein
LWAGFVVLWVGLAREGDAESQATKKKVLRSLLFNVVPILKERSRKGIYRVPILKERSSKDALL